LWWETACAGVEPGVATGRNSGVRLGAQAERDMEQIPSNRLEELIRERTRLDVELERCKEMVTVLFVDIVGSTRFYDEHGDVAGLVMVQKALDLLIPIVEDHEGTVIKTIGDAILARYCDVVVAVRSAIEMQRSLEERNRGRAPADQIRVRVAINLGLALLKGNDVFGDVVNVTARIEGATDANEIAISPSVYEKIQHLPDIPIRKKASGVELKGKSGKLDLYSVVWQPGEAAGPAPPRPSKEQLLISTGLHTGLADMAQPGRVGSPSSRSGLLPQSAPFPDKTIVFGTEEVETPPEDGVRFTLARVYSDGSLGQRFPLDHPGVIAGQKGQIALTDDPLVAPQHARFTQLGEGVYVEDLGSSPGVYLWVREPHRLKNGDIFQIGRERLRFVACVENSPAAQSVSPDRTAVLVAGPGNFGPVAALVRLDSNDQEMERYELRSAETSFGRSKGTYTFPNDPYLSTIHARIRIHQDQYILEDLGSTNGTFARIRKRALARDGDTVMIGRQLLRVLAERSSDSHD
jgi:class 3 adenylate cyclase/pSer/pThr/pTyr-binding forkhead associated (FHA) protein